jgi:hypothetical protein
MEDSEFMALNHKLLIGLEQYSKGKNISVIGKYFPDLSAKNNSNKVSLVIESEHISDRKAFLNRCKQVI